jgi:hypothetical protein
MRAEQVSAAVDQLLREPGVLPGAVIPEEAGLLRIAQRLAQLPASLGPVDPVLEQRVLRLRHSEARLQQRPRFKLGWAVAGLVVALLLLALLTPLGQTAVASFMAVFQLGRTEVHITPADTPTLPLGTVAAQSSAVQQRLTLAEAQAQVAYAIPQPTYLPAGYELREVVGYTYPDLPAWVPQPFSLELVYEGEGGRTFALHFYPITLGEKGSVAGMNLEASPIHDVQDVDVNGQPGVLLQVGPAGYETLWQELVWEQGDLVLALSARDLPEDDLLRIARSVR